MTNIRREGNILSTVSREGELWTASKALNYNLIMNPFALQLLWLPAWIWQHDSFAGAKQGRKRGKLGVPATGRNLMSHVSGMLWKSAPGRHKYPWSDLPQWDLLSEFTHTSLSGVYFHLNKLPVLSCICLALEVFLLRRQEPGHHCSRLSLLLDILLSLSPRLDWGCVFCRGRPERYTVVRIIV